MSSRWTDRNRAAEPPADSGFARETGNAEETVC
jgi:hypothetical protein